MNSIKLILLSALLLITAACGGGGGTSPSTTVTGVASAGIIKQGDVKVFALYSTLGGRKQIATGKTDNTGKYNINIGSYTGPVVIEVSGSYSDEANPNNTITISPAAPLRAMAVTSTGTVNVAVTPLTELGVRQAVALTTSSGRITAADVNTANAQISDLFKIGDIISTQPLDASASISGSDSEQVKYTLALAALSQYGADNTSGDLAATLNTLAGSIHTTGYMDLTEVTKITTSLSNFLVSGANSTGLNQQTAPQDLSSVGKTTLYVTAVLSGSGVKSVQTDIALPANVSVATSGSTIAAGVLTNLIGGANPYLVGSSVSAGTIRVIFNETDSMPAGNIFTIKTEVAAGIDPPAISQFILSGTQLKDLNGVVVGTASLSLL